MDEIQQLSAMLASGNGEQVKQAQSRLKALGFYTGNVDGSLGKNPEGSQTVAALQRYQAATAQKAQETQNGLRTKELEIELAKAQAAGKQTDANVEATNAATEATKVQTARKQQYDKDANSGLGMATQSAASVAAPAVAAVAGLRFGEGVNKWMDAGQKDRNVTLRGAAEDRVRGLTTREGAITGTKLAGTMPSANPFLRVGGRMAAHTGLAALSGYKGAELLLNTDEDQPFYPRMADRAAGLGYIGFGGGILKRGIQQAQSPGVSPDAQALAIINSSQLRRNNAPAEPEAPSGPRPGTVPALRAEAKAAGIPQAYKMNKGALTQALESINQGAKKLPGLAMPLAAGSLAYAATPDRAEAADGSGGGGNQAEAFTNAGVAGGTAYGASKGLGALSRFAPMAGKAAGGALSMLTPTMAADAYDPTQEELNMDRNTAARTLPRALQFGSVDRAYQMAQVPERAPAGGDGFANARALQIPAGIPLPRRDGSSPYGDAKASAPMDFNQALAEFQSLMAQQGQQ